MLDPFGGSGSTLIACETIGRCARLIELDPKYVDVIVTRWQEMTGKKAMHVEKEEEFGMMSKRIEKSAIDRQRESTITLEIGDDDSSQIREFLSLSHALFTVTDLAVYRVLLADDIDPERTNPNIPNQSQKIIPSGYNDPIIAKILLTASIYLIKIMQLQTLF